MKSNNERVLIKVIKIRKKFIVRLLEMLILKREKI